MATSMTLIRPPRDDRQNAPKETAGIIVHASVHGHAQAVVIVEKPGSTHYVMPTRYALPEVAA